jgi:hypothetical protein
VTDFLHPPLTPASFFIVIMKHFFAGAAALVLALSTTAPAMAQQLLKPKSATELDSNLAKHGCRERLLRTEDNLFDEATLLVTCDIDTVKVDKELRTWFFAANHGDTYYDSNSNLVTAAFLEYAAASSLLFHYKTATPDLDSIAVIGRIMGRDNYGHPVDLIAFTYGSIAISIGKLTPSISNVAESIIL